MFWYFVDHTPKGMTILICVSSLLSSCSTSLCHCKLIFTTGIETYDFNPPNQGLAQHWFLCKGKVVVRPLHPENWGHILRSKVWCPDSISFLCWTTEEYHHLCYWDWPKSMISVPCQWDPLDGDYRQTSLHQPAGGNYAWGSPANNEVIMKSAPKLLLVLVFSDFDEEPLVLVLKNKLEWFWT